MPDYNNSKIYRLKSKSTNQSYIGSTTQKYLSKRLEGHVTSLKNHLLDNQKNRYMTSFKILECDDYEIELITNFSCANKQQLEKEEGKYIKLEKEEGKYECVNQVIAGRTRQEYLKDKKEDFKEYAKKYREEHKEHCKEVWQKYYAENKEKLAEKKKIYNEKNKDKITEYKKKYNEENKEKITEYAKKQSKEYREKHKEEIKEKKKAYYEANKEKIKAKQNEKVTCEICGKEITKKQTIKCKNVANI